MFSVNRRRKKVGNSSVCFYGLAVGCRHRGRDAVRRSVKGIGHPVIGGQLRKIPIKLEAGKSWLLQDVIDPVQIVPVTDAANDMSRDHCWHGAVFFAFGHITVRITGDTALYRALYRGHSITGRYRVFSGYYRGHSTELPFLVFPGWGPGHNVFCGRTLAPVAPQAENHGKIQCWLCRSDVTLFISVQLLNHAIDGPRSHVCWLAIMRWVPVPSATDCKKHALVEPYCTSCRMHSSTVLPKDNADDIS